MTLTKTKEGVESHAYQTFCHNRDWLLAKVNYKHHTNTPCGWRSSLQYRLKLTPKQLHNLLHTSEVELCLTNYQREYSEHVYCRKVRSMRKARLQRQRNCEKRRREKAKSIGSVVAKRKPGRPKQPKPFTIEVPY